MTPKDSQKGWMTPLRFFVIAGVGAIVAQAIFQNVAGIFFDRSVHVERVACALGIDNGGVCTAAYALNVLTVVMLFGGILTLITTAVLAITRRTKRATF